MREQRFKQMALCLYVVLSLSISSIADCLCRDSASAGNHCESEVAQNHSHEMENKHHEAGQRNPQGSISTRDSFIETSSEECCCAASAPRVFAKSETVRVEKQTTSHQPNAPPRINLLVAVVEIKAIRFAKPFYLSDSFYNLKSPRASPRL